ncbi:MAG: SoxR reducing system RseC family protein [Pseudomonadota bacterium]
MAVEQGIVTEVAPGTAWVMTSRSASCEGCASKGSCMSKGTDMIVKTLNAANAKVGDRVVVSIKTGAFLRATFLIYMFPIICLLVGVMIGHAAAVHLGVDPTTLSAMLGMGSLAAALIVVKRNAGRMAADDAYQPKTVRIIGRSAIL